MLLYGAKALIFTKSNEAVLERKYYENYMGSICVKGEYKL